MSTKPDYFDTIKCIHDEQEPVGSLGRGTHYSVFRVPTWHTEDGKLSHTGALHDFAVIWDEDHDERVIKVIEALYFEGLLHPFLFVGERKGSITLVLSEKFAAGKDPAALSGFLHLVTSVIDRSVNDDFGDYWSSTFGVFSQADSPNEDEYLRMLINDRADNVATYLKNIHNLWRLGHKKF